MAREKGQDEQFVKAASVYRAFLRQLLEMEKCDDLPDAAQKSADFGQHAVAVGADHIAAVGFCLEGLLAGGSETALFGRLETEAIQLAVNWLEQLVAFYRAGLPVPQALVREIKFTFELIESSRNALSLIELQTCQINERSADRDPFADDFELLPGPAEQNRTAETADLFADDPRLTMEFELWQRTLIRQIAATQPVFDLFSEDGCYQLGIQTPFDRVEEFTHQSPLPVDPFAADEIFAHI